MTQLNLPPIYLCTPEFWFITSDPTLLPGPLKWSADSSRKCPQALGNLVAAATSWLSAAGFNLAAEKCRVARFITVINGMLRCHSVPITMTVQRSSRQHLSQLHCLEGL